MSTLIKATRHWASTMMPGCPVLWETKSCPYDEEVFVIRASDLKAIRAQVQDVLLGGTGDGQTKRNLTPCGSVNQCRHEARDVMDTLGLVPTPPRRKGRTR